VSGEGGGLDSLASRYAAMAAAGEIGEDAAQVALAGRLDTLNAALAERRLAAKGSALGWLFASRGRAASPVKGLYIHGEVGRGKTMMMDEFFKIAAPRRKRRTHFHEFMADVHERVHVLRSRPEAARGIDPILPVAARIAEETRLLCLDEFAVNDIADAMILSRLFACLFERGLVLVTTSNVPPDELYENGLNRGLFLPFIALLKRHADIVDLTARTDFRLEKLDAAPVYVTPVDRAALDRAFKALTGVAHGHEAALPNKGRTIRVPEAARGVARFSFADLCEAPLGAGDYLRIALAYHTVIIDGVPVLVAERRNEARRFITLIDTFYDHGVKLVVSAAAEPSGLYLGEEGNEAFAFRRTASRLVEMRSKAYLAAPRPAPPAESVA
jgi:cell division protein ZapE